MDFKKIPFYLLLPGPEPSPEEHPYLFLYDYVKKEVAAVRIDMTTGATEEVYR